VTNRVRAARTGAHLTQAQLAEQVQVSRQTIHAIEAGKYIPSTLLALKIGQVLGKRLEELFRLEAGD